MALTQPDDALALEAPARPSLATRLLAGSTIFLGAFLLFGIQPVIAKMILPWFGGSAAVWNVAMLFFQGGLLLGYGYAHWLVRARPGAQSLVHAGLLIASCLVLPVIPNPGWKPSGNEEPAFRILALLAVTIGAPYFLLSATSPLLQAWYSRAAGRALPYRLFALSNLACLLALLTYPTVFEPRFDARTQALAWSAAYVLFAALCSAMAWRARRVPGQREPIELRAEIGNAPAVSSYLLWTALAACSSALLLAVTNHLCHNVASVPFLWVVPLSVYLLTFILCFDRESIYKRPVWMTALAAALLAMTVSVFRETPGEHLPRQIALFSVCLFACCMFCHGELARRKPDPRCLTGFYVSIALGGALGATFVALAAPLIFHVYSELPVAMAACAALALVVVYGRWWPGHLIWAALLAVMIAVAARSVSPDRSDRVAARNFYGAIRVVDLEKDTGKLRMLYNGHITHGSQWLSAARRREPTTYYDRASGAGLVLSQWPRPNRRVGLIGLGAGTLAAYGQDGDTYRFYEINPLVIDAAWRHFTFLSDSRARVEVAGGDARLALERERPQEYDVLAVDAFSGDAIPVHLLSREAFRLYFSHLRPDGVIAVHISNRVLDLAPIVQMAAAAEGAEAWLIWRAAVLDSEATQSSWVIAARPPALATFPGLPRLGVKLRPAPTLRPWTDTYSNLFDVLK